MKKLIFIHILILFFLGNAVFARAGDYDEMDYGQFDDSAEQYADEEYYEDPYLYDDYNGDDYNYESYCGTNSNGDRWCNYGSQDCYEYWNTDGSHYYQCPDPQGGLVKKFTLPKKELSCDEKYPGTTLDLLGKNCICPSEIFGGGGWDAITKSCPSAQDTIKANNIRDRKLRETCDEKYPGTYLSGDSCICAGDTTWDPVTKRCPNVQKASLSVSDKYSGKPDQEFSFFAFIFYSGIIVSIIYFMFFYTPK